MLVYRLDKPNKGKKVLVMVCGKKQADDVKEKKGICH